MLPLNIKLTIISLNIKIDSNSKIVNLIARDSTTPNYNKSPYKLLKHTTPNPRILITRGRGSRRLKGTISR